jgi:hypothetical protein
MSPSEFEFLSNLLGEKILTNGSAFRKTISVQENRKTQDKMAGGCDRRSKKNGK